MKPGFILRRLRRRSCLLMLMAVFWGLVGAPLLLSCPGVVFSDRSLRFGTGLIVVSVVAIVYVSGLAGIIQARRRLLPPERNPDLATLARYGPIREVIADIEREIENEEDVYYIGKTLNTFVLASTGVEKLKGATVMLTRSWLIHLSGEDGCRMAFFRLDALVAAYRLDGNVVPEAGARMVVIDRDGVRLEIAGTEDAVSRLLTELLARVPWALTHFGSEVERTWRTDRQSILAAVDFRRARIQRGDTGIVV